MNTTLEGANEEKHKEIVKVLQGLLEKNYDAEKGFKNAIASSESVGLKEYLKHQAVKRNRFATEFDFELRAINETPKESGSVAGTLHRTWMDLKAAVSGNDDEAVLEECIRGDKASVEEYEDVFKNHNLPLQIENVVRKQLADINATLNEVKTLKDLA